MSDPLYFPVAGNDWRISSGFGNRSSPGGIGSTNHKGIDIAAPIGTGVIAPVSGTVIYAGQASGYGNYIKLRGDDGNIYEFGHLNSIGVSKGSTVNAGYGIGTVGNTGNSTGPHLHFGVKDALGKAINPSGLLGKGKSLLKKGGDLLGISTGDAVEMAANAVIPGSGVVLDALGVTSDCNWLCQLKNWIAESGFFQRLALAILAFIIIAGAVFMMRSNLVMSAVGKGSK